MFTKQRAALALHNALPPIALSPRILAFRRRWDTLPPPLPLPTTRFTFGLPHTHTCPDAAAGLRMA